MRFLTKNAPKLKEDDSDIKVISVVDALKHSDFLWHGRLGHINYVTLRILINFNHIPTL